MSNNDKNDIASELGPWIGIICCLVFFFPLGVILLLSKLRAYAKRAKRNQIRTYPISAPAAPVSTNPVKKEKQNSAPKKNKNAIKRPSKLIPLVMLLVSIVLIIFGASNIYEAAREIAIHGADRAHIWDLIVGASFCAGGLLSFATRSLWLRRSRRFVKFQTLVGKREAAPIPDIAAAAGVSERAARRALQTMIDDGWFGEGAYIDAGLNSLVISPEAAEAAHTAAKQPEPVSAAATENQYMAIIRELQELNITIIDESISNKIDRIEYVTSHIFRTVEENPSKLPQIRRFMSYYLPTTLKLLHAYATLEKQGISGDNISGAKQNIDRILDTLSKGFEQQLDMLFKSDVIDISSDISVLENMMKQDGLTGDGMMTMTDSR